MAKRLHSVKGERHTKGSLDVPVLIDKVQDLQMLTVIVEMLLGAFQDYLLDHGIQRCQSSSGTADGHRQDCHLGAGNVWLNYSIEPGPSSILGLNVSDYGLMPMNCGILVSIFDFYLVGTFNSLICLSR